jgi:hypothetical protein
MGKDKLDELRQIIGEVSFDAFLELLTEIGPDSRTHRISVIIAGFLRFALEKITDDYENGSVAEALVFLDEELHSDGEEYFRLKELIDQICKKAGMLNDRVTAGGIKYSIADNAIAEYCRWYNMPWEN